MEIIHVAEYEQELEKDALKEAETRYGLSDLKKGKTKTSPLLKESVEYFLEIGKRVLEVDGHHDTTIILVDREKESSISQVALEDYDDKYMFWSLLAKEVKRNKIIEVIVIGEAWTASVTPEQISGKVSDMPDKQEALHAIGISCKGDEFSINAPFTRTKNKIIFKKNIELKEIKAWFLEPIKRVWRGC